MESLQAAAALVGSPVNSAAIVAVAVVVAVVGFADFEFEWLLLRVAAEVGAAANSALGRRSVQ